MSTQASKNPMDTEYSEALTYNEELFHALIQHSADAIELLTEDGTIIYASASLQRVLGYDPEECIGTNIFSYIYPDDADYVLGKLRTLLQAPDTQVTAEFRVWYKNGPWV